MAKDARIDVFKGILILLVVAGHFLLQFVSYDRAFELLYWWIYLVHMPAFSLCSGIVIRSPERSARSAARSLIPVYVGFSLLHVTIRTVEVAGVTWTLVPLLFPGLHWYLLSLMLWRLALVWVVRLPRWVSLAGAVTASLLIGFVPHAGSFLSISRTVVFFPFFLAGYFIGIDGFGRLCQRLSPVVALVPFVGISALAVVFTFTDGFRISQLTGKKPYVETSADLWQALVVRLAAMVCTALLVCVVSAVLARDSSHVKNQGSFAWLARIGSVSMSVYLLHLYFVYPLSWVNLNTWPVWAMWLVILGGTTIAVAVTASQPAVVLVARLSNIFLKVWDIGARRLRPRPRPRSISGDGAQRNS
ncbi:acyltransferase family protein [Schaalia sp. ZJ405]|uniref:acyltransferase family protein n=1 Tax=Schaalia sp. ZJ405 TaxID=2709403 RepID=UPI0013E9CD92|nr:acyltransferase family protein [Schaalia sp. ZJ405]QPK80734.1 acyltransferase family protein [Schaalia sp. ZJ405]